MNQRHFNINEEVRKPGKHLSLDERGMIQALRQKGYSIRKIADVIGCATATVCYELKRGTPIRKGNRGRKPNYNAKYGQKVYESHRKNSKRQCKTDQQDCQPFIKWLTLSIRKEHWSIDACVGYAKLHNLFPKEHIPCTKTIYNMLFLALLTTNHIANSI